MSDLENFINLCNLTTKIVGLAEGDLALRSRKKKYQTPRAVASAVAVLKSKIHYNVIAKVLKRDRTLINHYMKNHKGEYRSHPAYRDLFNTVYTAYENIQNAKPSFQDAEALREHLRTYGIYDCKKPQVKIKIISGKVSCRYNFSYQDFSGKLEICRLALENYDMETKII